jgi:hypothetical protein
MLAGVRVATKPAFAVLVGAALALAQDLFVRITHIPITTDEAVNLVILGSWFAYWIVPQSLQDNGAAVVAVAPATTAPGA